MSLKNKVKNVFFVSVTKLNRLIWIIKQP